MAMTITDQGVTADTHDYYEVTFFEDSILTMLTHTPNCVDKWISDIENIHRRRLQLLVDGLYVHWRPNRSPHENNPVALLQLCVGRRCLIFQILHSPTIPESLRRFLLNPSYTFVGAGIGKYVMRLKRDHNLEVGRTADLRTLAVESGRRDLWNTGVKGFTRIVLGKELIKNDAVTRSNWDNRWLTPLQVQYACIDAFLSFEVGRFYISAKRNRLRFE